MQPSEWMGTGEERTTYRDLNPALAQEWLEKHPFGGQRKLHMDRVEAFARDMRNGLFGPSDFHFAVLDEWQPMMNGRHRCTAVLAANATIRARVHEIPIAKREDAGVVYSWFDLAGMRSQGEILAALGTEISSRLLNAAQNACGLIISGFEAIPAASGARVRSSTALVIKQRVIEEWAPYATDYLGLIVGQSRRMSQLLRRQTVMSVGMVTVRYAKERAIPFWNQLALNDVRPETPQSLLMDLFLDKRADAFPGPRWARFVAHAWNHYYDGNSLKFLRLGEAAITQPILIKGTPYDGKKVRSYAFETEQEGTADSARLDL